MPEDWNLLGLSFSNLRSRAYDEDEWVMRKSGSGSDCAIPSPTLPLLLRMENSCIE